MLNFQKLDVYQCATTYLALSPKLAAQIPRGYGELADQLRRAALSIPLNIAEGSSRFSADGARFYGIARGSALESVAVLDAMESLGFATETDTARGKELLERVVSMLTALIKR